MFFTRKYVATYIQYKIITVCCSVNAISLFSVDFVRVINPQLTGGEEMYCGDNDAIRETELYNGGRSFVFLSDCQIYDTV